MQEELTLEAAAENLHQTKNEVESNENPSNPISEAETTKQRSEFTTLICHSSEQMLELADESVHLTVTSPPYGVNKEYELGSTFEDWLSLMQRVCTEIMRVTVPGGRVCLNIAGIGRKPYIPLQHYLTGIFLDLGCLMRGVIIWRKGLAGLSAAWGSFCSATSPILRDVHEYVLVFSKGTMRRERSGRDTIDRDEFLRATQSIWEIPAESSRKIGHPTPFPVLLPKRLIELYSFQGDTVLDPFMGSGTTGVAAVTTGRRFVGYDIMEPYCSLAEERISQIRKPLLVKKESGWYIIPRDTLD